LSQRLAHNGPAIKGGCVTWRSNRAVSWYFSREIVPVQARYGALFACHGLRLIESMRNRGTSLINGCEMVPVDEVTKQALAQFRGTMLVEAI